MAQMSPCFSTGPGNTQDCNPPPGWTKAGAASSVQAGISCPSPRHWSRKKHLPLRLLSCLLLILEQGQDRFRRQSTETESWGSLQI